MCLTGKILKMPHRFPQLEPRNFFVNGVDNKTTGFGLLYWPLEENFDGQIGLSATLQGKI